MLASTTGTATTATPTTSRCTRSATGRPSSPARRRVRGDHEPRRDGGDDERAARQRRDARRGRSRTSIPTRPMDDGNPIGTAGGRDHPRGRRVAVRRSQAGGDRGPRQPGHRLRGFFLPMPDEVFAAAFGTEWFIEPGGEPGPPHRAGCWRPPDARGHLVRHGRAAAGWDTDPTLGSTTPAGRRPTPVAISSVRSAAADRDQPAAALPGDGRAARRRVGRDAGRRRGGRRDPVARGVGDGRSGGWLRAAMAGRGPISARATPTSATPWSPGSPSRTEDTVVFSHFVAINAAIGAASATTGS